MGEGPAAGAVNSTVPKALSLSSKPVFTEMRVPRYCSYALLQLEDAFRPAGGYVAESRR
jgi:hypothetical protein